MASKMRQFFKGMNSVIDLGATSIHPDMRMETGLNLGRTDAQALSRDWQKLSQDFGSALNKIVEGANEYGKPK